MRKADYSNRDRNAGAAIVGILVWKKGLPPELCSHYYRTLKQEYQACFEIGFLDRFEMRRFFTSSEYAATTQDQLKHIQTIHAFPERETYTLVHDRKLTLAGQRSYPVAETIRIVGAANQIEDNNVANLFFKQV